MVDEWTHKCEQLTQAWTLRVEQLQAAWDQKHTTKAPVPIPIPTPVPRGPRKRAREVVLEQTDVKRPLKQARVENHTKPVAEWTAVGWCAELLATMLQEPDDGEPLTVEVFDGPTTPGRGRTWQQVVTEHLTAVREGRLPAANSDARSKIEEYVIPHDDPRVGLRGQLGVRLRGGGGLSPRHRIGGLSRGSPRSSARSLASGEFVCFFGGQLMACDEVKRLVHSPSERARLDAYAFDLTTPATDGRRVCVAGQPPWGNIASRINDYHQSLDDADDSKANVAFGELCVRRGKHQLPLVIVYAKRAIKTKKRKPVELLGDYGPEYWRGHSDAFGV